MAGASRRVRAQMLVVSGAAAALLAAGVAAAPAGAAPASAAAGPHTVSAPYSCNDSLDQPFSGSVGISGTASATDYKPGSAVALDSWQSAVTVPKSIVDEAYAIGVRKISGTMPTFDIATNDASPATVNAAGKSGIVVPTQTLTGPTEGAITIALPTKPATVSGWTAGSKAGTLKFTDGEIVLDLVATTSSGSSIPVTVTCNPSSSTTIASSTVAFLLEGYWLATETGSVFGAGAAHNLGGITASATDPVVGIAATPSGKGYWVVTRNGTVANFGDALSYGDLPKLHVTVNDIAAIAPTVDGHGYWLIGSDGGEFAFGDAHYHGSLPGIHIHVHDIVGMVAAPSGAGYTLVGSDGGVFAFGHAHYVGSLPGLGVHVHDIRGILPSSTGLGYILVGADGGTFSFGRGIRYYGSLPGRGIHVSDIVGLALTPDQEGYFLAGANGVVYGFGDAVAQPTPSGLDSHLPVTAIAGV